jgi:hypothetical protein
VYTGVKKLARGEYYAQAVVDTSDYDLYCIARNPAVAVDPSGTFGVAVVVADPVEITEDTVFRVRLGKLTAPNAEVAGDLWYNELVGRVRTAFNSLRDQTTRPEGYRPL